MLAATGNSEKFVDLEKGAASGNPKVSVGTDFWGLETQHNLLAQYAFFNSLFGNAIFGNIVRYFLKVLKE